MIVEVKNIKWSGNGQTIDMFVKFEHMNEDVWFTASPDDPQDYGRELYQRAINGEFGEISE